MDGGLVWELDLCTCVDGGLIWELDLCTCVDGGWSGNWTCARVWMGV